MEKDQDSASMAAMEFSYRISEAEYLRARKAPKRSSAQIVYLILGANFLFWLMIFVLVVILWSVVQLTSAPAQTQPASAHAHPAGFVGIIFFCLILLGIFCLFASLFFGLGPLRARRHHRKSAYLRGQFTVNVTQRSISIQNSAGPSLQDTWNLYQYWRERNGLIVLVRSSREFAILNLAGLSDPQRAELRGLLTSALPQK
jgi:hypothetical protein